MHEVGGVYVAAGAEGSVFMNALTWLDFQYPMPYALCGYALCPMPYVIRGMEVFTWLGI